MADSELDRYRLYCQFKTQSGSFKVVEIGYFKVMQFTKIDIFQGWTCCCRIAELTTLIIYPIKYNIPSSSFPRRRESIV